MTFQASDIALDLIRSLREPLARIQARTRFLGPGAPLEDPAAREITLDRIGKWAPDGLSFLYKKVEPWPLRRRDRRGPDRRRAP
jgi:hypothetical protein